MGPTLAEQRTAHASSRNMGLHLLETPDGPLKWSPKWGKMVTFEILLRFQILSIHNTTGIVVHEVSERSKGLY